MKFRLGCNYWDSKSATNMWRNYDENVIREDMKAISNLGIKHLRVFPNWRDFQPVQTLYRWRGASYDNVVAGSEEFLADKTGIDQKQIENFRNFANVCNEYGISLTVSIVTGWMSGRIFVPPILEGKDLITNPTALMWMERYIRGFVSQVKDLPNIEMWDLGNECNCLGWAENREQAYVWTAFVSNAIRAVDPTRKISSGMHALSISNNPWTISDQGELTDYLTTHPYVSPSINNDYDPPNRMRSTVFPTVQSIYYSDVGGKPVIMQEQNCFTDTTANPDAACDFARVNIFSCISHNIEGHYWWCATEHINMDFAPYIWGLMERSLGVLDLDRKPKKIGNELKRNAEIISSLPFESLAPYERDGVCIISQNEHWNNSSVCLLLAQQAGLDVKFAIGDQSGVYLPKSKLYFLPGIRGCDIVYKHNWDILMDAVKGGATLFITYDGGSLIELESVFGLRANGNVRSGKNHVANFEFGQIKYNVDKELLLESVGAEVLATNEENNIVFAKNKYGKGTIFFLNFPLENNLFKQSDAFTDTDWYKIYQIVASQALEERLAVSKNPQIGITLHKVNETEYIVCAVNYSNKTEINSIVVKDGWSLESIHGSLTEIGKCDGAFYRLVKKS